ncbi:unnamed protein product [Phytophthora fragariaefolia]|uniref:Unnamed protein product n=1 Tax=Phytophthora fragariaefolia TaxID=1490495 RepID=A0A9W6XVF3_9STRA|nr:unnamed protein product [Phytophthora fragariaefolia]
MMSVPLQFRGTSSFLAVGQFPTLSKRLCVRGDDGEPTWCAKLTPDQAAALAIAREETGYASPPLPSAQLHRSASRSTLASSSAETTEDWKKARRREQCCINQANYRKRKRQHEQRLAGEILALEQGIKQLEAHRNAALQGAQHNLIKSIGDFYYAVGVDAQQRQGDVRNFRFADGSSPAL